MRQAIYSNPLRNQDWNNRKKNQIQTRFEFLSIICFGGGLLGMLLGSLLLFIFDATDKTDATLKYRGLAVILTAFFMLGCGAHYMDKLDDEQKKTKKLRIEHRDRKEIL